jgi:Replication initiator protein, pSAM2
MLVTITLPGFGQVHNGARMRRGQLAACYCGSLHGEADPLLGTPIEVSTYDYREHALALIFFPHLLDRFWQNYRRAIGWKIQYAGAVEMQRRLATHAHFAVRGTAPRRLTRLTAAATYHQVWWPPVDVMHYTADRPPVWDESEQSYVDPRTNEPLPTWG